MAGDQVQRRLALAGAWLFAVGMVTGVWAAIVITERITVELPRLALAAGVPGGDGGNGAGPADPMAITLRTLNVAEAEAALIERALVVAENNRTRAAELLGISVRTLRNKLNNPGKEDG